MSEDSKTTTQQPGKSVFPNLLSPIKIGGVEIKNRIVVAPMQEYMSGPGGEPTQQTIAYIGARAKGGAGMVISGVMLGTKLAASFPMGRTMVLYNPSHQGGPSLYAERIHYFGARACAQMSPGLGRQCTPYDPDALAPAPTANLPYEIAQEKVFNSLAGVLATDMRSRMVLTGPLTYELSNCRDPKRNKGIRQQLPIGRSLRL